MHLDLQLITHKFGSQFKPKLDSKGESLLVKQSVLSLPSLWLVTRTDTNDNAKLWPKNCFLTMRVLNIGLSIQLANVNGSTISHKFLVTNYSASQYKVDKKIHPWQMLVTSIMGCPHTPCHKFQWRPIGGK